MGELIYRAKVKLYRQDALRRFLASFSPIPRNKRWIFLVGCYNSGTTLLKDMIAAHPDVHTLPGEGVVFTDQLKRPEDFGWTRMWHMCRAEIELTEESEGPDPDQVKREWGLWLSSRKPVYLEKSIANSARIRWLDTNFENAYFLAIVRNGYAVAEGIRRRAAEGKIARTYPIELCARQWVINNQIIDRDGPRVKRFMRVTYEDLVAAPAQQIEKIFRFADLSPVNVKKIHGGISLQGRSFRVRNMNQESVPRLSRRDIENINREARQELVSRGYSLI
jgi:hypothetical protein